MRFLPAGLVIHRRVPAADPHDLRPIGRSRDGSLVHCARPETVAAFRAMQSAAQSDGVGLHVLWAYRDPDLQRRQFDEARRRHGRRGGIRWLAPAGFSEHQTGWVLDIGDSGDPEADDNPLFERTAAFRWLSRRAAEFGFELSFPPGNWQGVSYEPWHWRFTGTGTARRVFHPHGWERLKVWGASMATAARYWLFP